MNLDFLSQGDFLNLLYPSGMDDEIPEHLDLENSVFAPEGLLCRGVLQINVRTFLCVSLCLCLDLLSRSRSDRIGT